VRAHLFRRLRRWAGRRHVGFRRRVRGGCSGELHTIGARSDKWSWRRLKGEKDLPNLWHASVQSHPSTIPLIAYSSYVCSVACLAAKINGCDADAWPSQRSVLVRRAGNEPSSARLGSVADRARLDHFTSFGNRLGSTQRRLASHTLILYNCII
jgi:hypothetical protein